MKPNEINLESLNAEQLAQLEQQIEAKKQAEKMRVQQERNNYTAIVDDTVRNMVRVLQSLSNDMARTKAEVFAAFDAIIQMKEELFRVKLDRRSDTFTTSDGQMSIQLGYRTLDAYDDTVDAGIAKVKEYLATLAKDDNSAALVDTVMSLLAKNRKGELKASRILELERLAAKSGSPEFMDGINTIKNSYKPQKSGQFITVTIKNSEGKDETLPLSIGSM